MGRNRSQLVGALVAAATALVFVAGPAWGDKPDDPGHGRAHDDEAAAVTTSTTVEVDHPDAGQPNDENGGKPCDGCVGNANDKTPGGQSDGDKNAGFECDRNHGVGQGNPAHSHDCSAATSTSTSTTTTTTARAEVLGEQFTKPP